MIFFRILITLFVACCFCACSDEEAGHVAGTHGGVYIENSLRYGRIYKDPHGTNYNYRYMKASLRNDSTVPLYVTINFSNVIFSPVSVQAKSFRVFLLPETMTPENQNDDFYREQVIPFLGAGPETPMTVQKTILPKESGTFNFGFLSDTGSHLDPFPIVLFSRGSAQRVNAIPKSAVAKAFSQNTSNNLILALDFSLSSGDTSRPYALIPCGKFSFAHP